MRPLMQRRGVSAHVLEMLQDPVSKAQQVANIALARKPRFVIIGTGRSGSNFIAEHFTRAGIRVSHERYFTPAGPVLRHPFRDWRSIGESSWLAVPYLPQQEMVAIHQVRHPLLVIKSFYKIGFFDEAHRATRPMFFDFAKRYFTFSDDPLQSCLRWYVEWNERCEAITPHRYQVERFAEHARDIERWLSLDRDLLAVTTETDLNARPALVHISDDDLRGQLAHFPEFAALQDMSDRYGYAF